MKYPFLSLLLAILTVAIWAGCNKNACAEVECQNGGSCIDGTCDCPEGILGKECDIIIDSCIVLNCVNGTCVDGSSGFSCLCDQGYEGDNCDEAWYEKFIRNYNVSETCGSAGANYVMGAVLGPKFNEITFQGFHNSPGTQIVAKLINPYVFTIDYQPMFFGAVVGYGALEQDLSSMTIEYDIINGSDTLSCYALVIPQ